MNNIDNQNNLKSLPSVVTEQAKTSHTDTALKVIKVVAEIVMFGAVAASMVATATGVAIPVAAVLLGVGLTASAVSLVTAIILSRRSGQKVPSQNSSNQDAEALKQFKAQALKSQNEAGAKNTALKTEFEQKENALKDQLSKKETELAETQAKLNDLSKSLENEQSTHNQTKSALENEKTAHGQAKASFETEQKSTAQLKERVSNLSSEIEELKSKMTALTSDNDRLKQLNSEQEKQVKDILASVKPKAPVETPREKPVATVIKTPKAEQKSQESARETKKVAGETFAPTETKSVESPKPVESKPKVPVKIKAKKLDEMLKSDPTNDVKEQLVADLKALSSLLETLQVLKKFNSEKHTIAVSKDETKFELNEKTGVTGFFKKKLFTGSVEENLQKVSSVILSMNSMMDCLIDNKPSESEFYFEITNNLNYALNGVNAVLKNRKGVKAKNIMLFTNIKTKLEKTLTKFDFFKPVAVVESDEEDTSDEIFEEQNAVNDMPAPPAPPAPPMGMNFPAPPPAPALPANGMIPPPAPPAPPMAGGFPPPPPLPGMGNVNAAPKVDPVKAAAEKKQKQIEDLTEKLKKLETELSTMDEAHKKLKSEYDGVATQKKKFTDNVVKSIRQLQQQERLAQQKVEEVKNQKETIADLENHIEPLKAAIKNNVKYDYVIITKTIVGSKEVVDKEVEVYSTEKEKADLLKQLEQTIPDLKGEMADIEANGKKALEEFEAYKKTNSSVVTLASEFKSVDEAFQKMSVSLNASINALNAKRKDVEVCKKSLEKAKDPAIANSSFKAKSGESKEVDRAELMKGIQAKSSSKKSGLQKTLQSRGVSTDKIKKEQN